MSCIVNNSCPESLTLIATQYEEWIIQQALILLEQRFFKGGPVLLKPGAVRDYLRLKLVPELNEVFAVVFLNSRYEVLAYEPLFKGSVEQTAVYPRVVVQRALAVNASGVILAHQHPSGVTEPSAADRMLTEGLKAALALVDVRVVDHLVIGKGKPFSFSEAGLLWRCSPAVLAPSTATQLLAGPSQVPMHLQRPAFRFFRRFPCNPGFTCLTECRSSLHLIAQAPLSAVTCSGDSSPFPAKATSSIPRMT